MYSRILVEAAHQSCCQWRRIESTRRNFNVAMENLRASKPDSRRQRREHRPHRSHLERIIIYRRNALLGVYFGLPGIFLGALLLIFRWGLFLDHGNEAVLGLFVFLAGYIGIIAGCAYWLKAKGWSEALVAIGFMPFGIFATPIVRRLILFASPLLLPVGLFMMSLILIAVVVTLPDKSGMGRRRKTRHRVHRSRSGDRGF